MRWFRFAVLVLVSAILQTSLVGVMAFRHPDIKPDLLLILLVFFAIHLDPQNAVIASFLIGFAADLSNPVREVMGPQMISFGIFGTLLSDVHGIFSIQRMSHQGVTIFIVGALTALLSYLLTFFRADVAAVRLTTELLWQPLYSAAIGPFLFFPIGWWMRIAPTGRRRRKSPFR